MKKTILFLFLSVLVLGSLFATGGDDFAAATNIGVLPYADTGDTSVGFTNIIGNTSADAFYMINSTLELTGVTIDLTGSSFDTYMRVYDADQTTQLWSDDDGGSGNTSKLSGLTLSAGNTYYVCVEGYSSNVGAYTLSVVADQTGNINNASAPAVITNADPASGATEVALLPTITWDFGANTENYDLFFGTANPPVTQVVTDGEAGPTGSYTPAANLVEYTTYYWKVISKNSTRSETANAVHSFTTVDLAPKNITLADPADAAIDVALDATLSWTFDLTTESYDLFFDTVDPPVAQVVTDGVATVGAYDPGALTANTVYYWKVVSKNTSSLRTVEDNFSFSTILGEGIVSIGAGSSTGLGIPVEPYYGYTYSQTIYLQSEIDTAGQRIEKIWYHYNGGTDLSATTDWVIYMGHTADAAFATNTSWVPLTSLTKVYENTLDPAPDTDTWIEFVLETPFVYNNSDNLVIAVEDNASGYDDSSDEFFCTSDATSRAIQYQNDSTNPDPASPPSGNLKSGFANIRLAFGDLPEVPEFSINPESKDFGTIFTGVDSVPQIFTIMNNGGADLVIENAIALETGTHFTLTDVNSYPLTIVPAASVNISVTYNATIEGEVTDNILITDNVTRTAHSIPLTGTGFEATVSVFPYTESFDDPTVPTGWTVDPIVSGDSWEVASSEIGGHGATGEATGNGGNMMVIDDSTPETVPAHLYSPPLNFGVLVNPTLSFNYWIGDGANTSELHIDVDVNGTVTSSVAVVSDADGATEWANYVVSLSAFAGNTVIIDFRAMESSSYLGDICLDDIYIFDNSNPPSATTLVSPIDTATEVALTGNLEWNASAYTDGYNLYFGSNNPPTDVVNGTDLGDVLTYAYSGLATGTTYYWQVVPYNINGIATSCPIWSFETTSSVPDPATFPEPNDNAIAIEIDGTLIWDASALADGYYLNFGTDNPPTNILALHDNGTDLSYLYSGLTYSTMYYWQVIPYNAAGNADSCPVWSFTAEADPRLTTPYYQNFDTSTSLPTKWSGDMTINSSWGRYGSHALIKNLWSNTTSCSVELENMTGIAANDYLTLYYRIVNYSGVPNNATTLGEGDAFVVEASTNNGGEYVSLYTVNNTNHTASNQYAKIEVPVGDFIGNDVKFRISGAWASGDWYLMIDNFFVGQITPNVIISEVNAGATQYVELYNAGTVPASLNGWSLQQQNPVASTIITPGLENNLPNDLLLYNGRHVVIIGGTLAEFMVAYPTYDGYYIVDGDAVTGAPQMGAGSWFILDDGLAKAAVDQFGSAALGASPGVIYERLDAESNGDDIAADWAPVLAPTPGEENENDIQNDQTLPVELTSFAATTMTSNNDDSYVSLEWTVESENHISGYNVYRSETTSIDEIQQINNGIIVASNEFTTHSYNFDDSEVSVGDTFNYWLESVSIDGISQFFGPVAITIDEDGDNPDTPEIQKVTAIQSIFPNPFNPSTSVSFSLKEESNVKVNVYNVRGELVSQLANDVYPSGTDHTVVWNGLNKNGKQSGSGIYFFKMEAKGYTAVKKAVLVK